MAMKDISDFQVLKAFQKAQEMRNNKVIVYAYDILIQETREPEKVCYKCMERVADRGFIDYGVSLRTAWITDKGEELLKKYQ